jgi:membrane-associated phospholipid phosphatase
VRPQKKRPHVAPNAKMQGKYMRTLLTFLFFCAWSPPILADVISSVYFTYTQEELNELKAASSDLLIFADELRKWDYIAEQAAIKEGWNFLELSRFFTYLYAAQAEAANLSYILKGSFAGSLDPVSYKVISLFFSQFEKPQLYQSDGYSQILAEFVTQKIKQRIEKENASNAMFGSHESADPSYTDGLNVATWIPWAAMPSADFWPPAPPAMDDSFWKNEIKTLIDAQNPISDEKKDVIYRWSGIAFHWSGNWRAIVNQYIFSRSNIPLKKILKVRIATMLSTYDAIIAYMGAKYHHMVPRPKALNPDILYVVEVPKNPSYPSGQAAIAGAVSTIMVTFFPTDADNWRQFSYECRQARIWAGIHYPIDEQTGRVLGQNISKEILRLNLY